LRFIPPNATKRVRAPKIAEIGKRYDSPLGRAHSRDLGEPKLTLYLHEFQNKFVILIERKKNLLLD